MRKTTLVLTILALGAGLQPAMALGTQDSMTSWTAATDQERSGVVDDIMSKATGAGRISRPALVECLNRAAESGGHAQLPISEIAHACSHPSDLGTQDGSGIGI